MSELCDAVATLNVDRVQRLLEAGHNANAPQIEWSPDLILPSKFKPKKKKKNNDADANADVDAAAGVPVRQPARPLEIAVFRASDCTLTEEDHTKLSDIVRALLEAGGDPRSAQQLALERYGDDDAEPAWEAVKLVQEAAASDAEDPPAVPAATTTAADAAALVDAEGGQAQGGADRPQLYPDSFTVMSYNVLIPNSKDGWWIYKM